MSYADAVRRSARQAAQAARAASEAHAAAGNAQPEAAAAALAADLAAELGGTPEAPATRGAAGPSRGAAGPSRGAPGPSRGTPGASRWATGPPGRAPAGDRGAWVTDPPLGAGAGQTPRAGTGPPGAPGSPSRGGRPQAQAGAGAARGLDALERQLEALAAQVRGLYERGARHAPQPQPPAAPGNAAQPPPPPPIPPQPAPAAASPAAPGNPAQPPPPPPIPPPPAAEAASNPSIRNLPRLKESWALFRIGFEEFTRLEMKHGKALLTLANGQPVPPDLADDNDVLFGILSMALTGNETPPAALQVLHEAHDRGDRDGARLWRDLKERLEPANLPTKTIGVNGRRAGARPC